jgi:hypothetical protein
VRLPRNARRCGRENRNFRFAIADFRLGKTRAQNIAETVFEFSLRESEI